MRPFPLRALPLLLASLLCGCSAGRAAPAVPAPEGALAEAASRDAPSREEAGGKAPRFGSSADPETLAARLVARMTDQEVLGQLFMIAYRGMDPPPEIFSWIRDRGLGGVKIFGWNSNEDDAALAGAIARMQEASLGRGAAIPLLVATDEEGGWIRHVKGSTSVTPGNMAIGAGGFPADAYESGRLIGRELAALGINMDFAPAVDLATSRDSWLIGSRSFSDDPMTAAILGAAFARGLNASGVAATAKHFPGHGATDLDSHNALPRIGADWDTLWKRELVPYRVLSGEGVDAVMTGHLSFPAVDPSGAPASLSRFFIGEVLRGRLGYRGVVVTDDLRMAGAVGWAGSLEAATLDALEAGNDIVMFSTIPEDATWNAVLARYRSDRAFAASCRQSASRVLSLKIRRLAGKGSFDPVPDLSALKKRLPDPEMRSLDAGIAGRSVTLLKKEGLPLAASGKGLLLVGQFDAFFQEARRYFPGAAECRIDYMGSKERRAQDGRTAARAADASAAVLLSLANDDESAVLAALKASGKPVYVISVLSPSALEGLSWPTAAVAAYSYSAESYNAACAVLAGRIPASGRLPLEVSLDVGTGK